MALKLTSKLLGLVTIILAFSTIQVSASMTCHGNKMKTKKEPGLLCREGYVPYDAYDCANFCSCIDGKLKCTAPDDCVVPQEDYPSMEAYCEIGPNYDWTCQCPDQQDDANVLFAAPPSANFTEIPFHGQPSAAITETVNKTMTATVSILRPGPPLSVEVNPFEGTPTMHKRRYPSPLHLSSHPTDRPFIHGPPHITQATTLRTTMVPKSALEQTAESCTFRLGNGGCEDEFPVEVIVNKRKECISASNAFGFGSYSYEVTDCSSDIELCYLFNDDVCNGGSFEGALTYKNYIEQRCFPKPGGDGFAIGSIYCP